MDEEEELSQRELLIQDFFKDQQSTGSQRDDLLRDIRFVNDPNAFKGQYGVYAGQKELAEDLNKDRFKKSSVAPMEGITNDNNMSNSETTLTPEKRSSNFKQTAELGKAFDAENILSGNVFDSGAFSFLDDMKPKSDFKLNTRGDDAEKELKKVNAAENIAIDQGYKDAVKKTTTESMGAAKAGEKNRFSKTRGGLFGNYGKEVTINKIVNPETGKVSREKFVDGKYVSSTAERKNFRKQKKEGRQKARQQKISNIKDKVTGVFEKSRENREKRQQTRSNKRNNKGGLF